MQIGMIGLGKMGANMVRRMMAGGHECVVTTRNQEKVKKMVEEGAVGASSVEELVGMLSPPRAAWSMVPAGEATEHTVNTLAEFMNPGDMIIDGGNSYFKDDVRRAKQLSEKRIHYVDVGTSGGIWGLERGYCMMIGGEDEIVNHLDPLLRTLAPGNGEIERTPGRDGPADRVEEGYLHCGPAGAGHFVKMVHNGMEYGLMQAYAEGFDILKSAGSDSVAAGQRFELNLQDIAEVWRRGSVISSWLLDLTAAALLKDPDLKDYSGSVHDSGEGRWTVMTAVEEAVPADVISAALYARFRSRQDHTFAEKVLSAMRWQFGGHQEDPSGS